MDGDAAVGSIARAARVLEHVASAPHGASLAEIVAATEFSKTTTHRVLAALLDVDYVSQDPERRIYRLGSKLAEFAYRAKIVDIAAIAQRSMRRLADLSGDTVFFTIIEGAASVCVARELGSYPVRTLTLDRGERTPLGVGGGALALYGLLSDAKRAAANQINERWLEEYGVDAATLEKGRRFFLEQGYSFNDGMIYPETNAIGLPIIVEGGRLAGAISIGALASRMTRERIDALLLPALRAEAATLRERLTDAAGEPIDPNVIKQLERE